MNLRRDISAGELEELYERINRALDRVGVESQPKVVMRVLELAQDKDAQIKDYADVIRADWAMTGRVLRLANSAYYAQRTPVTRVERALVLLGLDRTKAVTLGFYLSRAAMAGQSQDLARRVWKESVYRASLASALSRSQCPGLAPEAFVVGLMLDCGIPLLAKLAGAPYEKLVADCPSPAKLYTTEYDSMEYTHVDVAAALMKRWKMPPLLTRPIGWHHTLPPVGKTDDAAVLLQRVAYYAGAVQLGAAGTPRQETPLPMIADKLFEIARGDLNRVVEAAGNEYGATVAMFDGCDQAIEGSESLADAVQHQLVEILDEQMGRALRLESRGGTERFMISGHHVEVEPGRDGEVLAYLSGSGGERIIGCTVRPDDHSADSIRKMLGLSDASEKEMGELVRVLRSMAA